VIEIVQLALLASTAGASGQLELRAKSPVVVIPAMDSALVWLLTNVSVWAGLVVFTNCVLNPSAGADKAAATTPVPFNFAVCGEFEPLSLTVSVPVRVPWAVGAKTTEILQVALAARVAGANGHVEVSEKSPEVEMLLTVSATFRLFVSVTVSGVLLVCTTQLPKPRLVGARFCPRARSKDPHNNASTNIHRKRAKAEAMEAPLEV
jgi:hypothetical protein